MKKNIIAVLLVAVILFVWQALSWMVLGLHNDMSKYTPNDAEIVSAVSSRLHEDGVYMMPGYDPDKTYTSTEREKMMTDNVGKPYMLIFYHRSFPGLRMQAMALGILFNMVAAIIAVFLVNMAVRAGTAHSVRLMVVMALPAFSIFQSALLNWNWWEFPWHFLKGEIMDAVIGWALAAVFLAWYLRPLPSRA